MKKIATIVIILFACVINAQRKPKIKGSRIVTEVQKELADFHTIKLVENFKITLKKSVNPGYQLITDDNLLEVLKFEVIDGVLTIGSFYRIVSRKQLDIIINYTTLNSVIVNNGSLHMDDMIGGDNLSITTRGNSKVQLNTNASSVTLEMEDSSSGSFSIDTDSLAITLKDRVNTEIYAVSEKAIVEMYNGANAKLDGSVDAMEIHLLGNANLKAEKLQVVSINALVEESITARLNASNTLNLSSRDKAKTYLYGNSKVNLIEFLDASELSKRTLKEN